MLAFLLALGLWILWLGVGHAVLLACGPRRQSLRNWLLAPSVGLACTLLALHWLNRAGWPVDACARPVAAGLACAAVASWWASRDRAWRRRLSLVLAVASAMAWAGWPMFVHGLQWFGFGNDDMANYALGAQRVMTHGAFEMPDLAAIADGRDYPQGMWHRLLIERAGAELLLAFVASVTGRLPWDVFMATILALHGALIAVAGALVAQSGGRARTAATAMGLVAVAPLALLGTIYQLLGQAMGLVLLFGSLSVLGDLAGARDRRPAWRRAIVPALLLAALLVSYPEVLPFYAAAAALLAATGAWRARRVPRTALVAGVVAMALVIAGLNTYLWAAGSFLFQQATSLRVGFPFYLLPSGPATFAGILHLASRVPEPLHSAIVLAGLAGLSAWCAWIARDLPRGRPVTLAAVTMVAAALVLFLTRNGFGLYKLAMFAQVPLWGTLALWWSERARRSLAARAAALVTIAAVASVGWRYVRGTDCEPGVTSMAFCEVPYAGSGRFIENARAIGREAAGTRLLSDVTSPTMAKLLMHELRGRPLTFTVQDFVAFKRVPVPQAPHLEPDLARIRDTWQQRFVTSAFPMDAGVDAAFSAPREWPDHGARQRHALVTNGAAMSVLNRQGRDATGATGRAIEVVPLETPNHLSFVSTDIGQLHYAADRSRAALWQLEPDYFFRGRTMAGLGRYLLFQVLQPDRDLRLSMWITASLKGNGANRLPPAVAVGAARRPFRLVGRGSARVVSPPVTPLPLIGREFVGLDMGEPAVGYPIRRSGLMRLYGGDLPSDLRILTVYGRDLSAISSASYASWHPPAAVSRWPDDLANPHLEYSGAYEDGWVSEHSYFVLDPGQAGPVTLALEGDVPALGDAAFTATCRLSVDGRLVAERAVGVGRFHVEVPVSLAEGRHEVSLDFSAWQQLPRGDDRPVAARLRFAGFRTGK